MKKKKLITSLFTTAGKFSIKEKRNKNKYLYIYVYIMASEFSKSRPRVQLFDRRFVVLVLKPGSSSSLSSLYCRCPVPFDKTSPLVLKALNRKVTTLFSELIRSITILDFSQVNIDSGRHVRITWIYIKIVLIGIRVIHDRRQINDYNGSNLGLLRADNENRVSRTWNEMEVKQKDRSKYTFHILKCA